MEASVEAYVTSVEASTSSMATPAKASTTSIEASVGFPWNIPY